MSCANKEGVKNILLTFVDCETGEKISNISHKQPLDADNPTMIGCAFNNTDIGRGRVSVAERSEQMTLTVQGDNAVPISYYQGCASVTVQVEWFSGEVWTGEDGNVIEPDASNRASITMTLVFEKINVMLAARRAFTGSAA